jgi:hypothetical protein
MTSSSSTNYSGPAMTSSSGPSYSDLVRTTQPGQKVQEAVANLAQYFDIEKIAETEGYIKIECVYDASQALNVVRTEFKEEFKEVSNKAAQQYIR